MKTTERPLHNYVAEVSEYTEVRRGVYLLLGTHESEGGVNFALFSRHATRVRLELFDQPADAMPAKVLISIPHATARVTYGTYGLRGFVPVNSTPAGWMGITNPGKD